MVTFFTRFLFFCFSVATLFAKPPEAVYVTWVDNPSKSAVIQWITDQEDQNHTVFYQKLGETEWVKEMGDGSVVKGGEVMVHAANLQGLMPDSEYVFKVGDQEEAHRFKTLPKTLSRPLSFVVGGDAYHRGDLFRKMNAEIARHNPEFVVMGGDIAYTTGFKHLFRGKKWESDRWVKFFRQWQQQMVTTDGRLIPIIAVVGNHDVKSKANPYFEPVMFYDFFFFKEKAIAYRALDVGDYLSLILLDSGHTHDVEGRQTEWLKENLDRRKEVPHKFAVYHVSAYPSFYPYEKAISVLIRKHWVPLFEQIGMKVVFEHHNHCYKRTYPIKDGKVDPSGVVYFGDGAWGVTPRKPVDPKNNWFLAKTAQLSCYNWVTLEPGKFSVAPRTNEGKPIEDPYTFNVK